MRRAGGRACVTRARSAGAITGSSRTRDGRSTSSRTGRSAGPPRPAGSTPPSRRGIQSESTYWTHLLHRVDRGDDRAMPSSSDTYLHGHHDSVLRSHRWRTAENSAGYLLPRLAPDARVLDVGCGPGTITADLAARVPGGDVTGIDAAADVLAQARQEAGRRGQRHGTVAPGGGDAPAVQAGAVDP